MAPKPNQLSEKATAILEMISRGHNYDQILSAYPAFSYTDIFQAAAEALTLSPRPKASLDEKRERYPRAYEKWTEDEEHTLGELIGSGETVARIAGLLQRNRGAIRARILKLGLENKLSPAERERFDRGVLQDRPQQQAEEAANHEE